jgi:Ser/Thr protein kinase RdoA (MazF antagonist)
MGQSTFPAQSSILSSEALVDWLGAKYRLRQPFTCVFHHKGVNDTYKIATSISSFYLRIYVHGWRTKAEVEAEVSLLRTLAKHDLPICRPVKCHDGSYVQQLAAPEGMRHAVLFTGAGGRQSVNPTRRQCFTFGALAARVHQCADRHDTVYKRFHIDAGHLIDEPLNSLGQLLDHRRKDFDFLQRIGEAAKIEAMKLPRTTPEYGVCHGDLHAMNVFFKDSDKPTLFDFDCFGYGWRAYDVSIFLWSRYWAGRDAAKRKLCWNAFLRGYQSERRLSRKELQAIPIFGVMRQIWLMGLHADISERWGIGFLNDRYFDRSIKFVKDWVKEYRILK